MFQKNIKKASRFKNKHGAEPNGFAFILGKYLEDNVLGIAPRLEDIDEGYVAAYYNYRATKSVSDGDEFDRQADGHALMRKRHREKPGSTCWNSLLFEGFIFHTLYDYVVTMRRSVLKSIA